ncbi:MAG TPA: hypothetical protein VKY74_10275 [Chloroflexia bacterium]|nr:hypothetical protein [Chloroflexia bacterium]
MPPKLPRYRTAGLLGLVLLATLIRPAPGSSQAAPAAPPAAGEPRFYAPTGQTLDGAFTAFYDSHGGLAVFGYPIDAAHQEGGYLVQYSERERLEYHPEYAGTPFAVLLGRLGAGLTADRADGPFAPVAPGSTAGMAYVPQTHHQLGGRFLTYWQAEGGLALFGYPISEEFVEDGVRQQWFERARFEYHPELPAAFQVSLGLLGREIVARQAATPGAIAVAAGPPRPRHLQLGLAQGGESPEPGFLHNAVPLIGALGVSLIRLDNLYTSYHVVTRDASGHLVYNWSALDQVVDDVRAMGAQPLMCLSYTPPALSPDGSPIQPPTSLDDWRQLVQATVRHFNIDRGLGIQYWEVWNEPDQWGFWRGSWPDYLQLYDVTREAVHAVDPQARVGGPARANFDPGALNWFLSHQEQPGSAGGVDFLSWHAYGFAPQSIADQIGTVRNLLATHPTLRPELAITEFNVTPGDGDTSIAHLSDTSQGAAFVLAELNAMDRAGLDRAFLFEIKDGYNPQGAYWGRWGMITNDGHTKPVYHAIRAYQDLGAQRLPVQISGGPGVGALAAAPGGQPRLLLWNNGPAAVHAQISLPPDWAGRTYSVTLFDSTHNNPQVTGDDRVSPYAARLGSGLIFDLAPGSVLIATGQ